MQDKEGIIAADEAPEFGEKITWDRSKTEVNRVHSKIKLALFRGSCVKHHPTWQVERSSRASLVAPVKSPPAETGDPGSPPDLGRSHLPWSSCISTVEPVLYSSGTATSEPRQPRACALQREAPTMRGLCAATRESLCAPTKTKHSPKEINI